MVGFWHGYTVIVFMPSGFEFVTGTDTGGRLRAVRHSSKPRTQKVMLSRTWRFIRLSLIRPCVDLLP